MLEIFHRDSFFFKELLKKDLKQRYSGSRLGLIWMFVNPLVTILMYWIIFEFVFKMNQIQDIPYLLWLTSGILPWFYYLDVIGSGTVSLIDYKYLVSKVKFNISYLRWIKLINSIWVHIFYIALVMLFSFFYGYLSIYAIQLVYYAFCLLVLCHSLIKLTSVLHVFFRDTIQFVNVLNTFIFWATPVFWSIFMVDTKIAGIIMINPLAYLVEGYRNALVYHLWFFNDMRNTAVFWGINLLLIIISEYVFKRLKPYFADEL